MLRFNPIYMTGLVVILAALAILWQSTIVRFAPNLSLPKIREEETRQAQTEAGFSTASVMKAEHNQESLLAQPSSLCTDPPPGHCEFYRDCLESKYHCGEHGYPLGYGEKFCQKFVAGQASLSPAGQKWMMGTMQCLQRVLVPDATGTGLFDMNAMVKEDKCQALKEKAFNSHSRCYLDNGLCALSGRDWVHIVEIIGVQTLFDSWSAIKESIEAAEGCL